MYRIICINYGRPTRTLYLSIYVYIDYTRTYTRSLHIRLNNKDTLDNAFI